MPLIEDQISPEAKLRLHYTGFTGHAHMQDLPVQGEI